MALIGILTTGGKQGMAGGSQTDCYDYGRFQNIHILYSILNFLTCPFTGKHTMKPILTVEFRARIDDLEIKEESVPLHSPEEFFKFIAPGGGCDVIPNEVDEIRMMFLPPAHVNHQNPLADAPTTLQLGIVFFNGPLSEITQMADQLLDKAGRGELSESFLNIIGVGV